MHENEKLKAIRERLEAATPGPWSLAFNGAMRSAWAIQQGGTTRVLLHLDSEKNIDLDQATHRVEADLDFIQFSRSDIEELLKTIDEMNSNKQNSTENYEQDFLETQATLIEMTQRYERLKSALLFYAHPRSYQKPGEPSAEEANSTPPSWIGNDLGRRAREVLGIPEPT